MNEEIISEIDFPLTKKIKYHKGGEEIEGSFIKLVAPSAKQLKYCTELKQAFMRSIGDLEGQATPEAVAAAKEAAAELKASGKTMGASDIMETLYISKTVDMVKVLLSAIELFKSGVAKIDGEADVTAPIMGEMLQEDLELMTGEYLANFTLRSVLNKMR